MSDQRQDYNGQRLHQVLSLAEPPEFVKNASSDDIYGPELSSSVPCADIVRRRYPIHTKAAVWVSHAFMQYDPTVEESTKARLKRAAELFGVQKDLDAYQQSIEARLLKAAQIADEEYGLVITMPGGKAVKKFPIRNPAEVKAAEAYLKEHQDAMPLSMRMQLAGNLLKRAEALNVGVEDLTFVEKQAGHGWSSKEDVVQAITKRAFLVRKQDPALAESLLEAAEAVTTKPLATSQAHLQKLASMLDQTDRAYDLKTGEMLPRPEDALFGVTVKAAEAYLDQHCQTSSGSVYQTEDFSRLKLADVQGIFGEDFAKDVAAGLWVCPEKMAEQAKALPRPDAELLDRIMSAAGVRPVSKEASAQGGWLTQETLEQLAKL